MYHLRINFPSKKGYTPCRRRCQFSTAPAIVHLPSSLGWPPDPLDKGGVALRTTIHNQCPFPSMESLTPPLTTTPPRSLQVIPTLSCRSWRPEALAVFRVTTRRQIQSTLVTDWVVPRLTRWPETLPKFQPLHNNIFRWRPHSNPISRRELPRQSPRPFVIVPPLHTPKYPTPK